MSLRDKLTTERVEAAIARVLTAEQAAQAAIDAAARDAAARQTAARERARRILETADRRILAARKAVENRIAERQAAVDAAVRSLRDDPAPAAAPAVLEGTLAAVAAALTTGRQQ
jgi:hypothetical protein